MTSPNVARVLLVEDERVLGRIYARALMAAGFVVDVASDGVEGFELLLAKPYDVVVSDLYMPRMDGLELLEEVRRLRPTVPVVLVSAELDDPAYERVHGMFAVRLLRKPVTLDQLARAVEWAAALHASLARAKRGVGTRLSHE